MSAKSVQRVLLTGATGFIGRRLLASLMGMAQVQVRAVSRRPPQATGLVASSALEVVQGDALEVSALPALLEGIDVAYYLIHSMEGGIGQEDTFVEKDREAALAFGQAAKDAGVKRIIYLSGLEPEVFVSKHLQSRNDVEGYLARAGVPVTTLRAGFIIGPGSAGFLMLQGLVGQLTTMMINPDLHHRTQPSYVDDVVDALALCLSHPEQTRGRTFDLGAREVVTYFELVQAFCDYKGRRVHFVQVPWVPVSFASVYVAAVSHLPYALVVSLAEGLKADVLIQDDRLYTLFPQLARTPMREAMRRSFMQLAS